MKYVIKLPGRKTKDYPPRPIYAHDLGRRYSAARCNPVVKLRASAPRDKHGRGIFASDVRLVAARPTKKDPTP